MKKCISQKVLVPTSISHLASGFRPCWIGLLQFIGRLPIDDPLLSVAKEDSTGGWFLLFPSSPLNSQTKKTLKLCHQP